MMMAEIIPIPSLDERVWRTIDGMLAQELARAGLGTEAQRLIAADLRRRLAGMHWQQCVEFPDEMDRATVQSIVNQTGRAFQAIATPLFMTLAIMAVELYKANALPQSGEDGG